MHKFILITYRWLTQFGFDPRRFFAAFKSIFPYFRDYYKVSKDKGIDWPIFISQPCLDDKYDFAGTIDKHYFYQDIYVAKKIYDECPQNHIDIGSRIDGFIAHLAVFRSVKILDIRPLELSIKNISFEQANVCDENFNCESVESVSCLHTVEHFGLGRYGDPIGNKLWGIGLKNIWKIVLPGGKLYLSTPIGKQKIVYNAHRVFTPSTIFKNLDNAKIIDFAYVNDLGQFNNGPLEIEAIDNLSMDFEYGLGIFTFSKMR